MKKRDREQLFEEKARREASAELDRLLPRKTDRRRLLKGGLAALAAAGAASVLPKNVLGQTKPSQPAPEEENVADVQYDLDRFEDQGNPDVPPIVEGEDIEFTATDFTQGMAGIISSIKYLDPALKSNLVYSLQMIESYAASGDANGAQAELSSFRNLVINNADAIDAATGAVAFAEVTSFSQTILVIVDFLISISYQIVGVIFVLPWGQVYKILQVFEEYKICLTVTQITIFELYLRFFLFILVIRFRFFPGLRISIDVILIWISICIRVVIVTSFQVCIKRTRSYLLLVQC